MTEPLLCRTADGKIHWTSQCAGGGLIDSREYKTYCGQQVVSVIHEPITANDWYHNLTDEEKQHMKNVDKIMEGYDWNYYPVEAPIVKKIELWATGPVVDEKTVVMLP